MYKSDVVVIWCFTNEPDVNCIALHEDAVE